MITEENRRQEEVIKEIVNLIDKATYRVNAHDLLSDIFELGAIAVSNRVDGSKKAKAREEIFNSIMNEYDKATQDLITEIFAKLYEVLTNVTKNGFYDYLGAIYMASYTSSNKAGQFFTPYHVSRLLVKTSINNKMVEEYKKENKIFDLHEPTCGSGGMIMATADVLYNEYNFNYATGLFVECGDIDKRCVHMCYLQLALAGVPAVVYHWDTLTKQIWDKWHTPALCMNYLRFRKHLR